MRLNRLNPLKSNLEDSNFTKYIFFFKSSSFLTLIRLIYRRGSDSHEPLLYLTFSAAVPLVLNMKKKN